MSETDTAAPLTVAEAMAQVATILDGLRALEAAPAAAVTADGYPGNVAAGELIESAWGNAVVTGFSKSGIVIAGTAAGASNIAVGAGAQVGTITLPAGSFIVMSKFLLSATAPMTVNMKAAGGRVCQWANLPNPWTVYGTFAFLDTNGGPVPVTLENVAPSTQPVSAFPDAGTGSSSLWAIGLRHV